MGEVKPQDTESGLVARTWVRTSRKGGVMTEETLEGEHVTAIWQDRQGHVQQAEGRVSRDKATGELTIESWADGERRRTHVTRDANVTVRGRPR